LNDIFDILSFFFAFSHITTLHDWVTARDLFMNDNQDLPNHVHNKQHLPIYPQWGSARHQAGESRSTQGLEKNWDHLKKAKNYYQRRNDTGDLESILEAISQQEDQCPKGYQFTTNKPTTSKKDWLLLSPKYHAGVTAVDHKSSAFYSLEDGIALTCRVAIGSMMTKGGYVVYIPNDTFTKEWTTED
jgi:hypothetical protein